MTKENNSYRIDEITKSLVSIANLDFSNKLKISEKFDDLDILSVGLNMLGEEIQHSVFDQKISKEKNTFLLNKIVERSPLGTLILHLEDLEDLKSFRILTVNKAGEEANGVASAEIIGKTMFEAFPAVYEHYPEIVTAYKKAIDGEAVDLGEIEYGDEKVESSYFHVMIHPLGFNQIMVTYENITKQKRLEEKLNRKETEVINSIISSQENIRLNASKELHEGIGQTLFGLKYHLEFIESKLKESNDKELTETIVVVQNYLLESIENIRSLSRDLMPRSLVENGLLASIQSYINTMDYSFNVELSSNLNGSSINRGVKIALYRALLLVLNKAAASKDVENVSIKLRDTGRLGVILEIRGAFNLKTNKKGEIIDKDYMKALKRIELQGGTISFTQNKDKQLTTAIILFRDRND